MEANVAGNAQGKAVQSYTHHSASLSLLSPLQNLTGRADIVHQYSVSWSERSNIC